MFQIDNKLVSVEVVKTYFKCDLGCCKGACCVQGDSGAPLEENEKEILSKEYKAIRPYLSENGILEIEKNGTWVIDSDKEAVTPLINGKECAYVVFENDIAICGIEKAFNAKATKFRKPISCHLYPVRLKKFPTFEAVNYNEWHICSAARTNGENNHIKLIDFLKKALVRKYGIKWFNQLKKIENIISQEKYF